MLIDIVLHLDDRLAQVIQTYGQLTYGLLFFIVFAETGLVVTPLLPGDSLLFAAGALSSLGALNPLAVFLLLAAAAILGDTVNYWIGFLVGPRVFRQKNVRFLNREYLDRTHIFYQRYGAKVIVLARFIPIIRTFAPFVAGIGRMRYGKFLAYNLLGGMLWISLFVWAGYFFGNIPAVKDRFGLVVIIIIILSAAPLAVEIWQKKRLR